MKRGPLNRVGAVLRPRTESEKSVMERKVVPTGKVHIAGVGRDLRHYWNKNAYKKDTVGKGTILQKKDT